MPFAGFSFTAVSHNGQKGIKIELWGHLFLKFACSLLYQLSKVEAGEFWLGSVDWDTESSVISLISVILIFATN